MEFTTWPQNHNAPLRHGVLEYWSGEKATEECSAEPRPTKKSIRRQMVGRDSVEPTSLHRSVPPSFHSPSRQRASGTQARMPVRPAGFYPAEGKQASSPFGAQTWKSNVPPRPDNEPLKNGNRATAYRSSIC